MAAPMRYVLSGGGSTVGGTIPGGKILTASDVLLLKASGTNYVLVTEDIESDSESDSTVDSPVIPVANVELEKNDGTATEQEAPEKTAEPVAEEQPAPVKKKRKTRSDKGKKRKRKVDVIVQSPDPDSPVSREVIGGESSETLAPAVLRSAVRSIGQLRSLSAEATPVDAGDISKVQVGSSLYKIDAGKLGGLTLEQIVAMMGKFVQVDEGTWEWQGGFEPKPTGLFYLDADGNLVVDSSNLNDDGTVTVDGTLNDDGTYTVTV